MVNKTTMWAYIQPLLFKEDYMHLAEISKKLNKNHSVVRQYLSFFEKKGIILKKIAGRLSMYKINLFSPIIIDYIAVVEKEKMMKKCEEDLLIQEVVVFLHTHLNENNKSLIFGSSVEDSKKSNDIDILIIGKNNLNEKIKQLGKKLNIKLHIINVKSLRSVTEGLKKEIRIKHLIVQGAEEIIKWLM